MVGELVIAQAMLGQVVHTLPEDVSGRLVQVLDEVVHHTRELKDSVMSMRAQQVNAVFQRMPRLVRELATKTAKKVRLEMAGETTEVDRSIIERLGDPLTHIIRNSIDHGIESPTDRVGRGQARGRHDPACRPSTVAAASSSRSGTTAQASIPNAFCKRRANAVWSAPEAVLNDDEINNLIFLPGFSTAEKVSDISGRGVGMDVVRRNIQDVGGRISLKSDRGRGMTIQLALPLTLAVMDGMVIRVGQETYVMPMSAIVECLRPPASDIHNLIGTPRHAADCAAISCRWCSSASCWTSARRRRCRTSASSLSPTRARALASASSSTSCAVISRSSSKASRRVTAPCPASPAPRSSAMAVSRSFSMSRNCPILPAARISGRRRPLRQRSADLQCRRELTASAMSDLRAMRGAAVIRSNDNANRSSS